MDISGNSVFDEYRSAKINDDLYSSGIISPYSNSTYPLGPMIGDPSSRVSFSVKLYRSVQLLLSRY